MPDVKNKLRIAILDLYEGAPNEGMRCIRELIKQYSAEKNIAIATHEFDVRLKQELPDTSYDIYISSGGPGSPLGEEDYEWEQKYFGWLREIDEYNADKNNKTKKYVSIFPIILFGGIFCCRKNRKLAAFLFIHQPSENKRAVKARPAEPCNIGVDVNVGQV